jgi:hypothetical protein
VESHQGIQEPAIIGVGQPTKAGGPLPLFFIYILFLFIKRIKVERVFPAKYLVKIFSMCLTAKNKKCIIYLFRSNRVPY